MLKINVNFVNILPRVGSASTQQVSKRLQSELMNLMMSQVLLNLKFNFSH